MIRSATLSKTLKALIAILMAGGIYASAEAAEPVVIEASGIDGRKAYLGDRNNILLVVSGSGAEASATLPVGRHRVTAWLRYNGKDEAYRQTTFQLSCGGVSAGATVDALGAGWPLELTFVNRVARPVNISISRGTPTPEGRRELLILQADPGGVSVEPGADDEDFFDLDDALDDLAAFDAAASPAPLVLLERIEIVHISAPVIVSRINSDRITYSLGGSGTLAFTLENLDDTEIEAGVRVEMVQGIDERTLLLSERVTLPPAGSVEKQAAFLVGDELWGRGFEVCAETADGSNLATHAASVVNNPWQAAMHGRGTPMSGSERWSREDAPREARARARANIAGYNNTYEAFAWAPCDFSSMTPQDDEPFYSGQTQYCKKRSSLQILHEVFEEHGIFSITYGKACGSGLPGLEYAHTRPEQMNVFGIAGFAHEDISVDVIDRMLEGRCRRHGRHEDFWQRWISCWTHFGNHAATNAGCDEIAASAKLLGWHGVRYDGHFSVWRDPVGTARLIRYAEDRISGQLPDFVFGYNHCGPRHNSPDGAFSDIEMAAQAHGGGMVMSEYYRELNGNVVANIRHLQAAGDMVRLHGGYFLTIFDDASAWNAALVMAGGARPMGGGGLRKYATRFSAFILDPAMRRLQAPEKILTPVREPPFLWQSFIYEKQTGLQDAVLIMH